MTDHLDWLRRHEVIFRLEDACLEARRCGMDTAGLVRALLDAWETLHAIDPEGET